MPDGPGLPQASRSLRYGWSAAVAEVLALTIHDVDELGIDRSFIQLGGTSLRAAEVVARLRADLGLHVELADLLDDQPVAGILRRASAASPPARSMLIESISGEFISADIAADESLPASAGQTSMLLADDIGVGTAFHLLFSADLRGRLEPERLTAAIGAVVQRHPALRTVFVTGPAGIRARAVPQVEPYLLVEEQPDLADAPVSTVQATIAARSRALLRPLERPPLVFVLTRLGPHRSVLSVLVHHAIADGYSVGLLLREVFAHYGDPPTEPDHRAANPRTPVEPVTFALAEQSAAIADLVTVRSQDLAGYPHRLRLPQPATRPDEFDRSGARLPVDLTDAEREACEAVARSCGVTRNAALFAAWTLTLARFTGMTELLVGLSVAGRTTETELASLGLGTKMLPVTCTVAPRESGAQFVREAARQMRHALRYAPVPMEHLVRQLGLGGLTETSPLVQAGFSAHDDLIADTMAASELDVTIVEGHCGGTPFEAMLYVQRWGRHPRLALEYAVTAVGPQLATLLATGLRQSLLGLAADLERPVGSIDLTSPSHQRWLRELGAGSRVDTSVGLWQLIEAAVARAGDAVAIRDASGELTYAELDGAVRSCCAALGEAGVVVGDCVAVQAARSIAEVVGVLAVLRLGAHYVSIEDGTPDLVTAQQWAIARPVALLTESRLAAHARRLATSMAGAGGDGNGRPSEAAVPVILVRPREAATPDRVPAQAPPAAAYEPARPAYLAFTSGTTGTPKGVRVPLRAVVRLVREPAYLRAGATARFLRLAPLGFDASTLELFAPLVAGGCIEVYPPGPVAVDQLAEFISSRRLTGLWLTSGLFRLLADHHPASLRGVSQLLTGGDVVPPAHVVKVLTSGPGLRVSNGYGPTENTTFTSVHHVDDPSEVESPLPIGRPIQGSSVIIVDQSSGGLAPHGVAGELYVSGDGLALDYAGNPAQTADRFVTWSDGQRYYRTGDLVSWDARGRLRFAGRADHQVKISGYRVELDAIDHLLRQHPAVSDVLVTTVRDGPGDRRIVAAVVSSAGPGLDDELRAYLLPRVPPYALPSRWLMLDRIPLTANGKPDPAALTRLDEVKAAASPAAAPVDVTDLQETIAQAWATVLKTDDFGLRERFFDVGGSSIQLPELRAQLRARLPGHQVSVMDLLRYPTVADLARYLGTPSSAVTSGR